MDSIKDIQQQCLQDSEKWFPDSADSLGFQVLALCGEAGELANLVKKVIRGSDDMDGIMRNMMANELVDSFIYMMNIANTLGCDIGMMYDEKREYNDGRFSPGVTGDHAGMGERVRNITSVPNGQGSS